MKCKNIYYWTVSSLILFIVAGCKVDPEEKKLTPQQVVTTWADMALYITKNTPSNSPTFASRGFGYIGLTMYESIVAGFETHQSLGSQLNGLNKLPIPEKDLSYDWVLSLNAGQAYILKNIYLQTSDKSKLRIDSLENSILRQFSKAIKDEAVISRSVGYGRAVAEAIFQWSLTDGGHRAYLQNFDKGYVHPPSPGSWEPPLYGQSFSHYPLHPHWGKNRTFVLENSKILTPNMIRYDISVGSEYYKQFERVYKKSNTLTAEEKEIALWWNDDPGETFTPPGHSFYLAVQVIKDSKPDLIKCTETLARVGMAVADAFINCWKWKYDYYSERPSSYITRYMDERWESFWPDPPFPAFPSGHATQSAAASTVLIDLYGEKFNLVDSAHALRQKDELTQVEFKPRKFESFWQVTEETANSRFFGGIHSLQDNEVGLTEGKKIGVNVNVLKWHAN
jgi:PAP2 superfamily